MFYNKETIMLSKIYASTHLIENMIVGYTTQIYNSVVTVNLLYSNKKKVNVK